LFVAAGSCRHSKSAVGPQVENHHPLEVTVASSLFDFLVLLAMYPQCEDVAVMEGKVMVCAVQYGCHGHSSWSDNEWEFSTRSMFEEYTSQG
jgi:hypothetical protein